MANVTPGYLMGTRTNGLKTHCLRGHAFVVENTTIVNGKRICLECRKLNKKKYRARAGFAIKISDRRSSLKKNYNLSLEDFGAMEKKQNYVCAICSKPPQRRALDVDHDHVTGKVRGLLCEHCNKGLGHFYDNPGLMLLAAAYLQQSKIS